jgi:LysM repeat protein
MRRITIAIGLTVIMFGVLASQLLLSHADEGTQYASADPIIIDDIYTRINNLRTKRGLPSYHINQALMLAAQDQAQWLVATGIRTHFRPDGSKPSTRAQAAGYVTSDWCCGENYYLSIDATPDLVWNFWVWSPHHYENLVHPRFDEVGLGWSTDGRRIAYVLVFGNSPDSSEIEVTQQPTLEFLIVPSTPTPISVEGTYVVKAGDTLFRIAQQYGTNIDAIIAANGLSNPSRIYSGQHLTIPGTTSFTAVKPTDVLSQPINQSTPVSITGQQTYIVQPGDTLFRIARQYNASVEAIISANHITNADALDIGQQLIIPNVGSGFSGLSTGSQPAGALLIAQNYNPQVVTAYISSPTVGQVINDSVPIIGTVQFTDEVQFYKLEIIGGKWTGWTTIGTTHTGNKVDEVLEYLPGPSPDMLPANYQLRLVLVNWNGGLVQDPYVTSFKIL